MADSLAAQNRTGSNPDANEPRQPAKTMLEKLPPCVSHGPRLPCYWAWPASRSWMPTPDVLGTLRALREADLLAVEHWPTIWAIAPTLARGDLISSNALDLQL